MQKFNFKYGTSLRNIDPFADNLIVFYFYKSLAMFFNIWNDLVTRKKANINELFSNVPDFGKYEKFYNLVLIGTAVFLQFCIVYVPITYIVDTIHKNKSENYKIVPLILAFTAISLLTIFEICLDYQAILFVGFTLCSQFFMIIDNLTGSLICYGISLSCSLDALLYFPFLLYRIIIKVTKQMYR